MIRRRAILTLEYVDRTSLMCSLTMVILSPFELILSISVDLELQWAEKSSIWLLHRQNHMLDS